MVFLGWEFLIFLASCGRTCSSNDNGPKDFFWKVPRVALCCRFRGSPTMATGWYQDVLLTFEITVSFSNYQTFLSKEVYVNLYRVFHLSENAFDLYFSLGWTSVICLIWIVLPKNKITITLLLSTIILSFKMSKVVRAEANHQVPSTRCPLRVNFSSSHTIAHTCTRVGN